MVRMLRIAMAVIALTMAAVSHAWADAARAQGPLHVPQPDWRDQVIYFVMTDRFADGDSANNNQGAGEFDPNDRSRFSGGDFAGLRARLDYIQGLGATAVWVTPPVHNQWVDAEVGYGGYHGYWAADLNRVDPHLGTMADYQALSRDLHGRGMYLVQDIVLNHMGNFFSYAKTPPPETPALGWRANEKSLPMRAPLAFPFSLNNPNRARDRAAGIYHWTATIENIGDRRQELRWQLSGLDDLNTTNPDVRRALRKAYGMWLEKAGVDAFRVDTAFYVEPDLFDDLLNSADRTAPGLRSIARRTGRDDVFLFGEGFGIDRPFEDRMARKIESYMTSETGKHLAQGMINFPLYGAASDVFARGRPPAELAWRIDAMMRLHRRAHMMPTFVDNHDVDRFLAAGSVEGLKQNLLMVMTLPGIPVIYYGTEQQFTAQRASMFAAGWGSGGRDRFDTSSALYRYIADAIALRRTNRVFSRGMPQALYGAPAGPGVLAWTMRDGDEQALVIMNTADAPKLMANVAAPFTAQASFAPLFAITGPHPALRVAQDGALSAVLPPRSGFVWRVNADATASAPMAALSLDPVENIVRTGVLNVSGAAAARQRVRLVLDGDIDAGIDAVADARGRFRARVNVSSLINPKVRHALVAFDAASGAVSNTLAFSVEPLWAPAARVADARGDDTGPGGLYRYPQDKTYTQRTMDLESVDVETAGGALRMTLGMNAISQIWSPQNGFDHVALTVFIGLPGEANGARVMPLQNGDVPDGMVWHRRIRVHGWSNGMFSSQGASATSEGAAIAPAATIEVLANEKRIRLSIPARALGDRASLEGAQIYVNTWDYDGGYRALSPEGGAFVMGGAGGDQPKVMDSVGPFVLRMKKGAP